MTLAYLTCLTLFVPVIMQIRFSDGSFISVTLPWNLINHISDDTAKWFLDSFLQLTVIDLRLSVAATSQTPHAINLKIEDKFIRVLLSRALFLQLEVDAYRAHYAGEPLLLLSIGAVGAIEA